MAKNLRQLREKAATKGPSVKLKEIIPPKDNTVATQNFIKKHVVARHEDPAGNGDDVYNASNIKPVKRSPEHGYDPGQDEEVYENWQKELELRKADVRAARGAGLSAERNILSDPEWKKEPGHWEHAKELSRRGKDPELRKILRGSAAVTRQRRANTKAGLTNSYEPEGNLVESAPPGKAAEKWIMANKKRFIDEYGQEKGMRVLYAKAWKTFGENAATDQNSLSEMRMKSMTVPRATFSADDSRPFGNVANLSSLEQRMAKMAGVEKDQKKNKLMQAFRAYWGPDAQPPILNKESEQVLTNLYNTLNEENREKMIKLLESEEGFIKLIEFAVEKGID